MTERRLSDIKSALEDFAAGRLLIVVDDEDRENEGDFVCAAEKITPEIVNFMLSNGRGVLCSPISSQLCEKYRLPMMCEENTSFLGTPFTVSVDLLGHGCSTGVSTHDRAATLRALADENTAAEDLGRPGHIFVLRARDGGLQERQGHTEAVIELCSLCGLAPAGVLIEILNEDGTMARLPQLLEIGQKYGIRVISIEDLKKYAYDEHL